MKTVPVSNTFSAFLRTLFAPAVASVLLGGGSIFLGKWRILTDIVIFLLLLYTGMKAWLRAEEPDEKVRIRRKTMLWTGSWLLIGVAVCTRSNTQIEGVLMNLMGGVLGAALLQFLLFKLFGPLLFGRAFCGWVCWHMMAFEKQPFSTSPGRRTDGLENLPLLHLAGSIALSVVYWLFADSAHFLFFGTNTELYWLIAGNLFYWLIGRASNTHLNDNRGFCKYVCPVSIPMKLLAERSMLKIEGDRNLCCGCGTCHAVCPMDIPVHNHIMHGRVISKDCVLCGTCLHSCPTKCLSYSFSTTGILKR